MHDSSEVATQPLSTLSARRARLPADDEVFETRQALGASIHWFPAYNDGVKGEFACVLQPCDAVLIL